MASIYRSTIMRILNNLARGLCLSALLIGLCILPGCGSVNTEEDTAVTEESARDKKDFQKEVRDKSEQAQGAHGEDDPDDNDETKEDKAEKDQADSDTDGRTTMAQLLREMDGSDSGSESGESVPDTVLWFNATYAPLTYSNGGDWRIVGGMEPTSYNKSLTQVLMNRDWSVDDRESALETLDWLRDEGHRETYRKYQEELEDLDMLDLDADAFMEALQDAELDGYTFRYVIIYFLYQDGEDEEAMAAWDLCRLNQLCGDFYLCGYMTYEEAMDISLENSLLLQSMYSSWDELVESYMLGYQFWQSDPCLTDDSPTMQRYHYYEVLSEMDDGPYSLDWDMDLTKEW